MTIQSPVWSRTAKEVALYLPIFLALFLIGIAGGRAIGMVLHFQMPGEGASFSTRETGSGQHNLVLLIVDHISSPQPHLEGVWLLITLPGSSTLTLVPVFPAPTSQASSMADTFAMNTDDQPVPEFLDRLTDQILWDHYLVIDNDGISSTLDTFEAAALGVSNPDHETSLHTDQQLTLEQQIIYWQSICEYLSTFGGKDEIEILINQVSSNFTTNLSWDELPLYPLDVEHVGVNVSCEFPTLNSISP